LTILAKLISQRRSEDKKQVWDDDRDQHSQQGGIESLKEHCQEEQIFQKGGETKSLEGFCQKGQIFRPKEVFWS
jgi:hypothetical protein